MKYYLVVSVLLFVNPVCAEINLNHRVPSVKSNPTTMSLMSKSRVSLNEKQVEKHNGYKVIDSDGNEYYVDNIKKPKTKVVIYQYEDNSKILRNKRKNNYKPDVKIGKICFYKSC